MGIPPSFPPFSGEEKNRCDARKNGGEASTELETKRPVLFSSPSRNSSPSLPLPAREKNFPDSARRRLLWP